MWYVGRERSDVQSWRSFRRWRIKIIIKILIFRRCLNLNSVALFSYWCSSLLEGQPKPPPPPILRTEAHLFNVSTKQSSIQTETSTLACLKWDQVRDPVGCVSYRQQKVESNSTSEERSRSCSDIITTTSHYLDSHPIINAETMEAGKW